MINEEAFRVMVVDLAEGRGRVESFEDPRRLLGGSGLSAGLFSSYGRIDEPADHPEQPLIFAIGPLTGYFPLMSKTVLGFKSPYNRQYAESHAGGRLALALRFAGYDALVVVGRAARPSCLVVGDRTLEIINVDYLWGRDVITSGKLLRSIHKTESGRRSILRIGPAGEHGAAFASINVDTYRHFGRLGGGAVMGGKNLKAIIVLGDGSAPIPKGKDYPKLYESIFKDVTQSASMTKYHDLGTPANLLPLNELHSIPWRNLQATNDDATQSISGERFAEQLLLRKTACSGCPVGCIHVGLLREKFAAGHEYLYRQVSYDYEPIFAAGSMLGMTRPEEILLLLDEMERQGLDVMSTGVALAWATEALDRGIVSERETLEPLKFGAAEAYRGAIVRLANRENDFYDLLARGTAAAAAEYGGDDFACVLGQEMAGYATGEVFFVSQAFGFRHSHLDTAGYGFDQKEHDKDPGKAVEYLKEEERLRIGLTCMVSCLFARKVYSEDRLEEALASIGYPNLAQGLRSRSADVRALRWRLKSLTGFDPSKVTIPKRFKEVRTWKGPIDEAFLKELSVEYGNAIREFAATE
jgi:aldehyde:ferredoxin oxidoreductase